MDDLRLAVYLPNSAWGEISETSMSRGLGGRETALVSLCMEWAKMGHEVVAFVPRTQSTKVMNSDWNGGSINWIPAHRVLQVSPFLDLDMLASWEDVGLFAALKDADVGRRVVHCQVAHLHSPVKISDVVDDVAVLSPWAGRFLVSQHSDIEDKIVVLPNGVDLDRFPIEKVREKFKR